MRDVTDNRTGELEVGESKRGRGRPRKADAMTNAERQAAYRARRRAERVRPMDRAVCDPEALLDVADLEDDMAELRAELDATKAELAEAHETVDELQAAIGELNGELELVKEERNKAFVTNIGLRDELLPLRDRLASLQVRLDVSEADAAKKGKALADERKLRKIAVEEAVQVQGELAVAKKGAAKSVTRNENRETALYAEIKRSSKYYGQTAAGELFPVRILAGGEYIVQGGPGGQYRLKDVWLWAVEAEGKKVRLG